MKPFLALLLSTLSLLAARPEDVTAIWVGGSIQVSWLAPAEPPDIVSVQRRYEGHKDATWDVIYPRVSLAPATESTPARSYIQDTDVWLRPGVYEYRVRFGGKGGPWSLFAAEKNRPAPDVAGMPPDPEMMPASVISAGEGRLVRREGTKAALKIIPASKSRTVTPLPPRTERAPIYPPAAPVQLSATCQQGHAVLEWKTVGNDSQISKFEIERVCSETINIFVVPSELRPGFIAADNVTIYHWPNEVPINSVCVYRVRSFSLQGDPSPWSEQLPLITEVPKPTP